MLLSQCVKYLLSVSVVWAALTANATVFSSAPSPSIEVAFSPNQGAEELVLKAISSAHHSIRLAAYSFTSKSVLSALLDAKRRGVDVQCVLDKSNATNRSGQAAANLLVNAGIPTRIDSEHAIFHDKYAVIDGITVETGSFNYSAAAAHSNAENAVVVWGDARLATQYTNNWGQHWAHAEVWRSAY